MCRARRANHPLPSEIFLSTPNKSARCPTQSAVACPSRWRPAAFGAASVEFPLAARHPPGAYRSIVPIPAPGAHNTVMARSLHSCLLALLGSLSLAFFSVPLPEIPGLPPVLLWERAQQKATMVAIRTRKATPAPTATPMMTAIGTDSVGEKQTRLMRDKDTYWPARTLPSPSGAAPAKLGPDHCCVGLSWECLGQAWAGTDGSIGVSSG